MNNNDNLDTLIEYKVNPGRMNYRDLNVEILKKANYQYPAT